MDETKRISRERFKFDEKFLSGQIMRMLFLG